MISSQSRHSARLVRTNRSGDRVCLWGSHRCLDDLDAFAGEDSVEVASELAVTVTDQEAKRRWLLLECPGDLVGLLGDPGASRVRGAAGEVDAPAAKFAKKNTPTA